MVVIKIAARVVVEFINIIYIVVNVINEEQM